MNRIKQLREQLGITQTELGKVLNVKDSAISKYESGKIPLTTETILILADYFHVSIDFLLGRTDTSSTTDGDITVSSLLKYSGKDEESISFQQKLACQLDFNGSSISDLAKALDVSTQTVADWLVGSSNSYTKYYEQLSSFFNVENWYWTTPSAISPGIVPNADEYILLLLYRHYKEHGEFNDYYGSLENYFPGVKIINDSLSSKLLSVFQQLNEDNRDIIIGKAKELLKEQRYEDSVAAEKAAERKVSGK